MTNRGDNMHAEALAARRDAVHAMPLYDRLEELRSAYPKIAPPTVYNAFTTLTHKGRVHRMESLEAYIACKCEEGHDRSSVLSICDECLKVEERPALKSVEYLSCFVEETGLAPKRHIIEERAFRFTCGSEMEGTCEK
ncbi:MAG: hypothetical protein AAF066_08045 [Pseudomonadota bacterium]